MLSANSGLSGADYAYRAGHARAAEAAVAVGHLGEVLLVVVLGVVEVGGVDDLRADVAVAGVAELLLVGVARRLGGGALSIGVGVDARPVLGADVVALTH